MFFTNQVVKGIVAGMFMIVGFEEIGGNQHARLVSIDEETFDLQLWAGDPICLPLDRIVPVL